ncbi:Cytochrome protein, partial [Ophiophagus hannah]
MWLLGIPASISATEVLIGLAVFCLLFLVLQTFQKQIPRGLKRIPGPRGYPLIGNLLEVGTDVHLSLTQMSKTYGDVMMIHLGTKPILVLSGLETIKEALVRHGEDFKGRPDLYTFRHVTDGQSLSFNTDSGPVWVARRKLAQHALKTFACSPSLTSSSTCLLEDHVSEEAHHLMAKLQEVMLAKNRLDPYLYLTIAVANVVLAMCFGRRYDYDDEELLDIVINSEQFVESTASGSLATYIPVLQYLPNSKDHIRDITDSLIEESQKQKADTKAKIQLPPGKIVNLVNDIFGAGFSTVSISLSWCLMYLITYPEIQKKIQEEIAPQEISFSRATSFLRTSASLSTSGKSTTMKINVDEREKVLLFGLGKRRCIGEPIARREVFLFLATLLQDLQFSVPDGVTVNMTPLYGLTFRHERCEHVQVKQRFPNKMD